ncbi:MAG: helix-turn-helix transcriptional regulator [Thermaerobacterales bacterium]
MNLGKRLRTIRERNRFSLYDVERQVGLHFSTIAKYERNERQPGIDVLRDLAAVYKVPVAALITDLDDLENLIPAEQLARLRLLDERPALADLLRTCAALSDRKVEALLVLLDRPAPESGPGDPRDQIGAPPSG